MRTDMSASRVARLALVCFARVGPQRGGKTSNPPDASAQASSGRLAEACAASPRYPSKERTSCKAGAQVFVITQEDIRRSGATNIPDLFTDGAGR